MPPSWVNFARPRSQARLCRPVLIKRPRTELSAFLVLAALSLVPSSAAACRCREPSTAAAYRSATLVVLGETLDVRRRPDIDGDQIEVRVLRAWKRDSLATLHVVTASDCAYSVRPGERHLLFLVPSGDAFTTGKCMGNASEKRSKGALAWLRRHGNPAATITRAP